MCPLHLAGVGIAAVPALKRTVRMRYSILSARYTPVQVMIAMPYFMRMPERAAVVMVMVGVAVMPIPVVCPAAVNVPPARVITPVPGTMPSVPCVAPEPIIDYRPIDIYRFDDIVRSIHVFIANNLHAYLVVLIFLYVYRGYVLIDILCQNGLQNDQALVAFSCLHYA